MKVRDFIKRLIEDTRSLERLLNHILDMPSGPEKAKLFRQWMVAMSGLSETCDDFVAFVKEAEEEGEKA